MKISHCYLCGSDVSSLPPSVRAGSQASNASASSSVPEERVETPKPSSKQQQQTCLPSPGAASMSSFHDDFESVSSPSWPRTPASPVRTPPTPLLTTALHLLYYSLILQREYIPQNTLHPLYTLALKHNPRILHNADTNRTRPPTMLTSPAALLHTLLPSNTPTNLSFTKQTYYLHTLTYLLTHCKAQSLPYSTHTLLQHKDY